MISNFSPSPISSFIHILLCTVLGHTWSLLFSVRSTWLLIVTWQSWPSFKQTWAHLVPRYYTQLNIFKPISSWVQLETMISSPKRIYVKIKLHYAFDNDSLLDQILIRLLWVLCSIKPGHELPPLTLQNPILARILLKSVSEKIPTLNIRPSSSATVTPQVIYDHPGLPSARILLRQFHKYPLFLMFPLSNFLSLTLSPILGYKSPLSFVAFGIEPSPRFPLLQ